MMINLFSVFDPSTSLNNLSLNWVSVIIGLLIIPSMYWLIPSPMNLIWNQINIKLHNEMKILIGNKYNGTTLIFISMFSIILFNNFMGLFPYIFTATSHLMLTLVMSLPLWLTFMIFGWTKNTKHMLIHQVPQGTPTILMPFMVCIEMISNMIRPGTLAIRLTANMIAGHLLMTLLGNNGTILANYLILMLIMVQMMLLVLEMAVSIIQSYVFTVLMTLYSSEVT